MTTRDAYVAQLKSQLDSWNTDVTRWETQAKSAQEKLKVRSTKELDILKAQRELAMYNMTLLQDASATAWTDLREGADDAWDRMRGAIASARTHFEKTARPKSGA